MTREREEAIEILSDEELSRLIEEFHGAKEALDLALAALRGPTREMVERMRGEWRSIHGLAEYYCSRCGEEFEIHSYDKDKYQFCPHCMAPMTDETVAMMLKRLEEMMNEH